MEGPGLRSLYQKIRKFNGQNGRIYFHGSVLVGNLELIPYGKRLYVHIGGQYLMIFFGMSGIVGFRKHSGLEPSLVMHSSTSGYAYFYRCTSKLLLSTEFETLYDPEIDPLDPGWKVEKVLSLILLPGNSDRLLTDLLLDQKIMCGPGNIVKNEVLWRRKINPMTSISSLDSQEIHDLVEEVEKFSRIFLEARSQRRRRNNWLSIYGKRRCPRCFNQVQKKKLGETGRITYWCPECQPVHTPNTI